MRLFSSHITAICTLIFAASILSTSQLSAQRLDPINTQIEAMTLREKAARMLIVGVDGTALKRGSREGESTIKNITEHRVSGIILFEKNLAQSTDKISGKEQLKRFISDIKALAPHPLLVAIDQEGGGVNRLKTKYGFEPQPSHKKVGESDNTEAAKKGAEAVAKAVTEVGINLNFAPCVDVDINPRCPIVGAVGRSFSSDEHRVSELASIYCEEHRKRGVLNAIKHFPGHGSSLTDSHLGLTDISHTWQRRELTPYFDLVRSEACDMVMVSHLFNEQLDSLYPATLSRRTIEGLLRNIIGWQGVVVSDDMQMRAIVDHYGFEQSIELGINAGVDLFIVSGNLRRESFDITERFIDAIVEAVESGAVEEWKIDRSLRRILRLVDKI